MFTKDTITICVSLNQQHLNKNNHKREVISLIIMEAFCRLLYDYDIEYHFSSKVSLIPLSNCYDSAWEIHAFEKLSKQNNIKGPNLIWNGGGGASETKDFILVCRIYIWPHNAHLGTNTSAVSFQDHVNMIIYIEF